MHTESQETKTVTADRSICPRACYMELSFRITAVCEPTRHTAVYRIAICNVIRVRHTSLFIYLQTLEHVQNTR